MVTITPVRPHVGHGRRAIAIGALLVLLVGGGLVAVRSVSSVGAEVARTEALPGSFACIASTGLLATAGIGVALAPPTGFWLFAISALGLTGALAQVIKDCGAWLTTPLGTALQVTGHCEPGELCVPPPHGSVGGGGGGGGSW
jgi:hypothetical protein